MREYFLELIKKASTELPDDVMAALVGARDLEDEPSTARSALSEIIKNCKLAKETERPICQDTGTNIWCVYHPVGMSQMKLKEDILSATREATKLSYLRPNAVDSITGKNSGDNTGIGMPVIHFNEWEEKYLAADIALKGGGSENVSIQYSLPDNELKAGRDFEGIRRVVIDAVFRAQGLGCAPGIIGVGIGGDRATGMIEAKEQLFRLLTDTNPDAKLAELENRLYEECNELGIGPMGFGGKTTVLGIKVGARHRLPASYFVSIAYMCWAARRANLTLENGRVQFSQVSQIAKEYR